MPQQRALVRLVSPDGFEARTFTKVQIRQSFTDPLGSADFTFAPPMPQWQAHMEHFGKGEEVHVYVGAARLGKWVIQDAKREYDPKGGALMNVHCQSLLAAAYEGAVDPDLNLTTQNDVSVGNVILTVLGPYGFDRIIVDQRAHLNALTGVPLPGGKAPDFTIGDLKTKAAAAKPDQAAVPFLNKILSHLGAVMMVDGEGQILVCVPDYDQEPGYAVALGTGYGPEVDVFEGKVTVSETNKGQHSQVSVIGQASPDDADVSRPKPDATYAVDVLPARCVYRSGLHPYKPMIHKDKHARDDKQARNVAHLILGSHATNAYTITGGVGGWISRTGRVWAPGTIARTIIPQEAGDGGMFILERTLTQDAEAGQKTSMTLIPRNALILGDKS